MNIICVTGTPGSGKTALSKKLAKKLDFYYIDVNKIISKHKLSEGYDQKRKTKVISVGKLNKALIKEISALTKKPISERSTQLNGIIIDSHLSHYFPRKFVDFCIVTKCDIKELNKRLKKKRFHKEKIKENIEAEIFDVCLNEAKEQKHRILVIDTTKGFNINRLARQVGGH